MVDVSREVELKFTTDGEDFLRDLREAARLSREVISTDRARLEAARAVAAEARAAAAEARALAAQQKQQSADRLNSLREENQALKNAAQEEKNAAAAQQESLRTDREQVRLNREVQRSQEALNESVREEQQLQTRRRTGLFELAAGLSVLRNGYFAVNEVIQQSIALGNRFFNTFIRSNEELLKTSVETAAGIASTNQVFDETGQPIEDVTEAIQRLLPGLEAAREEVVALAAGIPGVTENDIQPIFNALAQNVGQLGGDIQRIPELSANATAALRTFNIPLFQARQEVNALVRGQIDQNAALARQLKIRREDIELARQQGRLFEFLNERFEGAAAGAGILTDLTENSLSNIQTVLTRLTREIGRPFLEPVQDGLKQIAALVTSIEEPILAFFEELRSQAGEFLEPLVGAFETVRERLQPFFDSLRPLFQTLRDELGRIGQALGSLFGEVVEGGLLEFIATRVGQILRGVAELSQLLILIGGAAIRAIIEGFEAVLVVARPVIAVLQSFADSLEFIREVTIDLTQRTIEWFETAENRGARFLRLLFNINGELDKARSIARGLASGDIQPVTTEINAQIANQREIEEELLSIARDASQNADFQLPEGEFEALQARIEAAFSPESAENYITGLREVLGLTEDTTDAIGAQELALESLEDQRRRAEEARINTFQDELDGFQLLRELEQDNINLIKEETSERQRALEVQQGALRIQEAIASLELARGQRSIRNLEEEGDRIQQRLADLQEEGASRSTIRAEERRFEENRRRLQEESEAQARREFELQQTQLRAQSAQIEAQRTLNQLKVDQLEVETEIARLGQEEQLRNLENQQDELEREGGNVEKQRELERSIAELQERLGETIERQGTFGQQRADVDRAAAEQQAALGIQNQAAVEAFIDEFGQLLIEQGDREATRINESTRLSLDERTRRLRELAEERSGVSAGAVGSEAPSEQQANDSAVNRLLEQLESTGVATFSAGADSTTQSAEAITQAVEAVVNAGGNVQNSAVEEALRQINASINDQATATRGVIPTAAQIGVLLRQSGGPSVDSATPVQSSQQLVFSDRSVGDTGG